MGCGQNGSCHNYLSFVLIYKKFGVYNPCKKSFVGKKIIAIGVMEE
jgi:hypothetical protein